jgi:hypothetical protein
LIDPSAEFCSKPTAYRAETDRAILRWPVPQPS